MTDSSGKNHALTFSSFVSTQNLDEKSKAALSKFEHAYALQKAGKLEEAAEIYKSVAVACPDRYEALYNLGVCQRQLGLTKEAVHSFESVARINRNFKPVYDDLAALYDKQGLKEDAAAARSVSSQL